MAVLVVVVGVVEIVSVEAVVVHRQRRARR